MVEDPRTAIPNDPTPAGSQNSLTSSRPFSRFAGSAWVMGAILVGFTLIQIRHLLRMRFSTAKI